MPQALHPMLRAESHPLEQTLLAFYAQGRLHEVATAAIKGYGPEILGFLAATLRDEDAARDVFSQFCEDLWIGLPRFRWQSSFRTWAYVVARNAAWTFRADAHNRRRRALSDCPALLEVAQHVRTSTVTYLRSDVKDRVARLRDRLDPEDQMMLILRVDRGMSFSDVARVLLGTETPHDDEAIARKSAALRKRFERIKEQLRNLIAYEQTLSG
jgi:RNA polymerase sigma-70 factor (ECF subfamily)